MSEEKQEGKQYNITVNQSNLLGYVDKQLQELQNSKEEHLRKLSTLRSQQTQVRSVLDRLEGAIQTNLGFKSQLSESAVPVMEEKPIESEEKKAD